MAIRRGDSALGAPWGMGSPSERTPRVPVNLRRLIRDVLLVLVVTSIPQMIGLDRREFSVAAAAIMLGLVISWRVAVPRIVRVLHFMLAYTAVWYSFGTTRDMADSVSWASSVQLEVWRFERWIFGGELLNARLQRVFYDHGGTFILDRVLLPVYFSFFAASLIVGVIMAWRNWELAWRYFIAKGLVLAAGLVMMFALPTAPPWMTPDSTLTVGPNAPERVYRITTILVGKGEDYVFQADGNPIAAMPSIHMATTVLILLLCWQGRALFRGFAIAYTAAMAFLLVYYGEHYVIDELVGALLAIGGWKLAGAWQRSWAPSLKGRIRQATAKIPAPPPVPGRLSEPAGD